jgi:uncharacterized membrane protein
MTQPAERTEKARTMTDDDAPIDAITGNLLRAGVLMSAVILLMAGSLYLYRHGRETTPDRRTFQKMEDRHSRPAAIFDAVRRGEARPMILVGLMVLIATPLTRVLFTVLAFAWRRDLVYVLIPLIVLVVLLVGIWTGQTE